MLALLWEAKARQMARSTRPIIVGPWRSEVGFEVLYGVPFLHSFRERYSVGRDRLIVIGRGGSSAWYDTGGSADLYEFLPVPTVRALGVQAAQQTGSVKQNDAQAWESHVCALTATSVGLVDYHVLSPSWMYRLVAPWWEGRQPLTWLDRYLLQPVRLPAPAVPPDLAVQLPPHYVAMRWYARPTWPHNEKTLMWTRKLVERVAKKHPVVLVNSGFQADDHSDVNLGRMENVYDLSRLIDMTPLTNLAVQSSVIAGAKAYIGTYGGLAQGAMRWGVPTYCLYDQFGQTSPHHLLLSQALSLQTGVPFVAGTPKQMDAMAEVLC